MSFAVIVGSVPQDALGKIEDLRGKPAAYTRSDVLFLTPDQLIARFGTEEDQRLVRPGDELISQLARRHYARFGAITVLVLDHRAHARYTAIDPAVTGPLKSCHKWLVSWDGVIDVLI